MKKLFVLSLCAAMAAPAVPAFGVGTSNWTHTNEADFKTGTFENVVATNLGDLKLSRAVRKLLEQSPKVSSVNALVQAPDGTIYAGTGPHGQILKISGDTVSELTTIEGATHVFALAIDKNGGLLVGTAGENGRVLKIAKPGDKPTEIFKADGVQYVWALQQTDDGKIYAATGPNGQLFEISGPGQSRVVLDADENNLLSLIGDGKDLLYVGTDPNGLVYRVNRKTGEAFVVYDAPEAEISALVIDKAGNVYAGTAEAREEPQPPKPPAAPTAGRPESQPAGTPIPSQPPTEPEPPKVPDPNPGQPDPIPKAGPAAPEKQNEPTAAKETKESKESKPSAPPAEAKSEGSAPKKDEPAKQNEPTAAPAGETPKSSPDKDKAADSAKSEHKPAKAKPTAPAPPGPGGPRPAGATGSMSPGRQPTVDTSGTGQPRPDGNGIYRIDTDGFVTEVFRQRALVLAMAERDGILFVATGSDGLVYQVNPAQEETIVLAKVDPKQVSSLLPAKDGNIYMGMANVGGIASIGSGFAQTGTYTSPVLDATQISRFGKMQLHGLLPAGSKLTVSTRSGNVKDPTQSSWNKWSDPVPAAEFLQVTAPTARFLQYKLTFTSGSDGKATPVVEDVGIAYQVPNLPPQVKAVKLAGQPEAPSAPAGPDAEPVRVARAPRQQISWEAADPNSDAMRYTLHFRRGAGSPWIQLAENISPTTFDWDTRSIADGRYEVRVTANDNKANPPGKGRSDSRVSDPVLIDNTAPVIGSVKSKQNGPTVDVELKVIDRTSIVAALDYAVDSAKGWQAVLPSDNIFDSPDEAVTVSIPGLSAGSHQIALRATDAKGNVAFETVMVNVESAAASAKQD
jgi:outer membrane protein assembly factor BamB